MVQSVSRHRLLIVCPLVALVLLAGLFPPANQASARATGNPGLTSTTTSICGLATTATAQTGGASINVFAPSDNTPVAKWATHSGGLDADFRIFDPQITPLNPSFNSQQYGLIQSQIISSSAYEHIETQIAGINKCGVNVSMSPLSGPPGTVITVTGSGWPYPGDAIDVCTWPCGLTIPVDSSGNFTSTFTVPANTPSGANTITFDSTISPAHYAVNFYSFTVTAGGIDLETTTIQPPPSPICAGSSPNFYAYIRNNGTMASGFFDIRWVNDGEAHDGGHDSILAGATDTHGSIWNTVPLGQHTLTFIADFDSLIPETNENNNQQTITFTAVDCSLSTISGQVTDTNNNGISGVTVSANGPSNTSTTTDANGTYTLSGLATGTYTITSSRSGYTFNPPSLAVTVPPDATNRNFIGKSTSSQLSRVFLPIAMRSIDVQITTNSQSQNEPTIAVDPNSPNILVAGANDFRQKNASNLQVPRCGWYFSAQAGSWTEKVFDPPTAFNPKFDAGADPAVAIDGKHNVYYSCLAFNTAGRASTAQVVECVTGVFVYQGQIVNGSLKWYAVPIEVISGSTQASDQCQDTRSGEAYDKPYLAADKSSGKVYVSWSRRCLQTHDTSGFCIPFGGKLLQKTQRILIAGLAADGTFSSPPPTAISDADPGGTDYNGAVPAIASNGTVYVAWHDNHANRILIDRSTNGGKNWGTDQEVATNADSFPTLAVDPTNPDLVYVAWASGGNIFFTGCTFTPNFTCLPKQKANNEPAGKDTEQTVPWMSIAPNGRIAIVYYSRTGQGDDTDVYVATRSGTEPFKFLKVTDKPFSQPHMGAGDADSTGDYIGIAADNKSIYPIWSARHAETGQSPNQDLFTATFAP